MGTTAITNEREVHIIRIDELCLRTGLSRSTIWRQTKAGTFPLPIRLGPNSVGWMSNEIGHWISTRARA